MDKIRPTKRQIDLICAIEECKARFCAATGKEATHITLGSTEWKLLFPFGSSRPTGALHWEPTSIAGLTINRVADDLLHTSLIHVQRG